MLSDEDARKRKSGDVKRDLVERVICRLKNIYVTINATVHVLMRIRRQIARYLIGNTNNAEIGKVLKT